VYLFVLQFLDKSLYVIKTSATVGNLRWNCLCYFYVIILFNGSNLCTKSIYFVNFEWLFILLFV
jgi:hypothetical protein